MEKTDAKSNDDECLTPRGRACRIPVASKCPPPPKKKPFAGRKQTPPTSGYFHPPDLDALFSMPPPLSGCEACA